MLLLVTFFPSCICSFLLYMTTFLLHLLWSPFLSLFCISISVFQHHSFPLASLLRLPSLSYPCALLHLFFLVDGIWSQLSVCMHVKPSQEGTRGHSFKLSKKTEERSRGDLSCHAKINTIRLINRRPPIKEILHVKIRVRAHVCVCLKSVCACLVGRAEKCVYIAAQRTNRLPSNCMTHPHCNSWTAIPRAYSEKFY